LEDDTEEGLVGEMAGVALGEAVLENAEDVGSSLARRSALGMCCVEGPFCSLSSEEIGAGPALVTSTELFWFDVV
jgi:hypothetical protein